MIAVYAAKHVDSSVRATSSSGGVFRALCEHVVGAGGVVYGARYDSTMRVVHGRAVSSAECRAFSGSKYVQSDMGTSFAEVKSDLVSGRTVLFSGTPCQVAGVKSYLSASRTTADALLTVDIVCHGVPSPRLWSDHVALVEGFSGARLRDFVFRDKEQGWRGVNCRAVTDRGGLVNHKVGAFGELFGNILRPSCHECPFASLERAADLTLGDYWGIEKHFPEFDDNRGISIVLVNTPSGTEVFEAVSGLLDFFELKIEQCLQPNLVRPTPSSVARESFWKTYLRAGYETALRRYTSYGFFKRHLRKARRTMRMIAR